MDASARDGSFSPDPSVCSYPLSYSSFKQLTFLVSQPRIDRIPDFAPSNLKLGLMVRFINMPLMAWRELVRTASKRDGLSLGRPS
jgi:hypothetical protein